MAKRSARRLRLRRALRILLLIALLGSVLYLLLEKSLTQVILNTAYAKAYAIAVETMNEAVRESLQSGAAYEDLITVRTDGAGRITMLAANTARMNELAVSVALRAQSALETRDSASIAVPLGAALKAPFFSSLGPRVPVRLSPVGSVSAAFATEFEAAGINQTRHQVVIEAEVELNVLAPGSETTLTVSSQISVAETVLIGNVPDSYTYLDTQGENLLQDYSLLKNKGDQAP